MLQETLSTPEPSVTPEVGENGEEDSAQEVVTPYTLSLLNPQTTHYKNAVLFMKVVPDNPGKNINYSKEFMLGSVLSLQMLVEDEWLTVCEYTLKNIDEKIIKRQSVVFLIEAKNLGYDENGTYRMEIKVIEPDAEYMLVSESFDLSVKELSAEPYDSNEFLSLYPFHLYDVNGVFSQSNQKNLMVGVEYTGCAAPTEQEAYDQIFAMACRVLSKETCAMNS